MSNEVAALITGQSPQELAPIVRQVLNDTAVAIGNVQTAKVGRSAGTATAGIYRVTGRAETNEGERPWSAVVKALGVPEVQRAWDEHEGMRELEVYRSNIFAHTEGGVRTPHCYRIQSLANFELIWLEDLSDAPQPPWESSQFVLSARHLGRFNARWPQDVLPDWPWLNRQGFRSSFTGKPSFRHAFEHLPQRRDDPLIRMYAPGSGVDDLLQIWTQCDKLLSIVETMPMGICHLDCHPKNLFPMQAADGSTYTIGIDWTEVGPSNLGIDPGHLLGSPMTWLEVSVDEARSLCDSIFDAYLAGLRDVGWSGNPDDIRLTYLTRLALEVVRDTNLVTFAIENKQWYEKLERDLGHFMTEVARRWNENRPFFVDCIEEASRISDRLAGHSG